MYAYVLVFSEGSDIEKDIDQLSRFKVREKAYKRSSCDGKGFGTT
jgi:hypothetical protein